MPSGAPAPLEPSDKPGPRMTLGPTPLARPSRKLFGRRLSRAPLGRPPPAAAEVAREATGSGAIPRDAPGGPPRRPRRRPEHRLPARRPSRPPLGRAPPRKPAAGPRAPRPSVNPPPRDHPANGRRGDPHERRRGIPPRVGHSASPCHGHRRTRPRPAFKPCLADENAGRAEVRWMAARLPPLNAGLQFRPPWARPDARRVFVALRKGLANAEDDGGGITPPRRRSARIEVRSFRSERKLSTLSFRIERRSLRRLVTFTNRHWAH